MTAAKLDETASVGEPPAGPPTPERPWLRRIVVPAALLLSLVGSLLTTTWYSLDLQKQSLTAAFGAEMAQLANLLAEGMREPIWNLIPESGHPLLASIMRDPKVVAVTVVSQAQGDFLSMRREAPAPLQPVVLEREVLYEAQPIGRAIIEFETAGLDRALATQRRKLYGIAAMQLAVGSAIVLLALWAFARLERQRLLRAANRRLEAEIAERHQAEATLRTREAWLNAILDSAPFEVVFKDRESRVLAISRHSIEKWGLTPDECRGRTTAELLGPEIAEPYMAADRQVIATGRALQREFAEPHQGRMRHFLSTKIPLRAADGAIEGVCSITDDITEMKQAEERLRQGQKMEAIGQLTGGIAHDFNNLLAIIRGNAELLSEPAPEDRRLVETILRASARGAALIQQLLAFSRQQPLRARPIDLAGLVDNMTALLKRTLGETIRISATAAPGLWTAQADPHQIENTLLNLAINARDAMPEGGRLTIACTNATLDAATAGRNADARTGDYVLLSVSDSGIGMTPEVLQRAFEPFFTTKPVGQGSGLGLSMIYGFAKQSGGHVGISSAPGAGTTVRLYLPRAVADAAQMPPPGNAEAARGHGEVVLVVEDDPGVRKLTVTMLEGLGYRTAAAGNAASARAKLAALERVDLLLTDVVLPGAESGPAFARALAADHPALRVVFMSGYAPGDTPGERLWPDTAPLLGKPFRRAELSKALRAALDGQRRDAPGHVQED